MANGQTMTTGWQAFSAVAAARGAHPAVVIGEVGLSFAQLHDLALRQGGGLRVAGVQPGDRVVLHLTNGIASAALPLALWAIGAVPVFAPAEVALAEVASRVTAALVVSERPSGAGDMAVCLPEALLADPVMPVMQGDAIGSILFTSGSTGRPKGVVQRHETLLNGVDRVAAAVGFGAEDRLLCAVPFAHDYGWGQLLAMYRLGLTLVLAPPGLVGLPDAVERHRPTVIGGVPSVYAGLTRGVSDMARRDRSSVRLVMSTGSAMPKRVWQDLAVLFPAARRCLNYGLTETFRSATLRVEDEALAPAIVGSALPGTDLCVVDAAGKVLPAGAWGEVVHRGAGVFESYWNDPDQTALRRRLDPVTGQGFAVFTGDYGCLDAAGRLTIGDRIDRMVKVMGLSASPAAIEAALVAATGVEAVAVLSRPHDILGAELVAVVVGDMKAAQNAALTLAAQERPRVWLKRDALPLTASGKVDLQRLGREVV